MIDSLPFTYRSEKKFIISDIDRIKLHHLIKSNRGLFSEVFYERRVNNIYLDYYDLDNYFRHVSGNSKRYKIRIRWYGNFFGFIEKPVLEFKMKEGDMGIKKEFKLVSFEMKKEDDLNPLVSKVFEKSNLPPDILEILKTTKSFLLNSYLRSYYSSSNKKVRLTVDRDLLLKPIFSHKIPKIMGEPDRRTFIIELKYNNGDETYVSQISQDFPFRVQENSKYINGINGII